MREAVAMPVTVKHRIGIDKVEDYEFVRDFVGTVAQAGCKTFIVHARNAVLKGLSPKENREMPPLKYDYVYRLKQDFPELEIIINGGITGRPEIDLHLKHVDGVMIGRAAYSNPWFLADDGKTRAEVVHRMVDYATAAGFAAPRHPPHARALSRDAARPPLAAHAVGFGGGSKRTTRRCCCARWRR